MITDATKAKVDDIWRKMREGGITSPLEAMSQLTYLMYMRQLDEREREIEKTESLLETEQEHIFPKVFETPDGKRIDGAELRWSRFKDKSAETMFATVSEYAFPFIKGLGEDSPFSRNMETATFGMPTPTMLKEAVDGVDALFEDHIDDAADLGDLYEYMLSKLNATGIGGQLRTPKHIRDMMVRFISPKPGELICDPACGTAGFLVSAAEHIRENHGTTMDDDDWDCFAGTNGKEPQFAGFEINQERLRISAMNLMLHSISQPDVRHLDSISKDNAVRGKYDVILASPPFAGTVDTEAVDDSLRAIVESKQTELLFVALFLRMLKLNGRCACIVPNGVLFRTNSKTYRQLRQELVDNQKLEAIVYMPSGVFKPCTGARTAVLVFTKTNAGGTDKVWLYNMEGDGFTLDDKRDPDEKNDDIPDILERWGNLAAEAERSRTEKSFLLSREEIVENDYDFSFNKYAKTAYKRVEYPPTEEILAEIEEANARIADGLAELKVLLEKNVRDGLN